MIDLILGVICEHRSNAHIQRHGGMDADSSWHIAHGERPTCDKSNPDHKTSDDPRHDNDLPFGPPKHQSDDPPGVDDSTDNSKSGDPGIWRRDHVGFSCTIFGCG